METGVGASPDSRHRLALGEHLGVGADADFQILRPGAGLDQRVLEPHRRGRARLESAEIIAQHAHDLVARFHRAFTAAARALFDHPLKQGFREGHAGGFDRLEVDRREQMRVVRPSAVARRVGENVAERPEARTFRRSKRLGRRGRFAKVAHGRKRGADVEDALLPDRDDRRAVNLRSPNASRQRAGEAVCRQCGLLAQVERRHGRPLGAAV